MFENVVVGVDDCEAGRDAAVLSNVLDSSHARLTLVYVNVVTTMPSAHSGAIRNAGHRSAAERLSALRDELPGDVEIASIQARSIADGLHSFAASSQADLLAIGASRRDPLARLFIGDHTREVLEDVPLPTAVAPAGYSERSTAVSKVGVAYDGSLESKHALKLAKKLAAERGAELSLFEAAQAPHYVRAPWNVEGEIERLESLARSVDLLVIATHEYGVLDRLSEWSTYQRLAGDVVSPLLVLPSPSRKLARPLR
jgi:nucleotide-binding universal stress UspA family protein